jgi:Peptidase family U32
VAVTSSSAAALLAELGLPTGELAGLGSSPLRFPDGAQYRIEIPSVEGPRCLEAVLEEAERLDVPVHRISQGSGVGMLTDRELDEMAATARTARREVSLFARPGAAWGLSATARSPQGGGVAPTSRGMRDIAAAVEEIRRAASHGFRSVLVADIGLLAAFGELRSAGHLPADMQAKVSAMLPVANPPAARVIADLGANTINLVTDLTLPMIAGIRAVTDLPLDVYIEAPDGLGGFVRQSELARLIDVAAPVYVKFGLRNAPDVYPAGTHLEATTIALSRERVRRARLGLELLARSGYEPSTSERGAQGLAVPVLAAA